MPQTKRSGMTTHRTQVGRIAGAAVALGGLSTTAFVVSAAGAVTRNTAKAVVISTANNGKLGQILVSGKTLYTLSTGNSACPAQCVTFWPEILLPKGVTKAIAGTGVSAAKLGTVKRAGGVLQVTYGGKALYWFSGDSAPGQVNGSGLADTWGKWSAVVTAKVATSKSRT